MYSKMPTKPKNASFFDSDCQQLLIILYQLSKIEAPICNGFWDNKFSMSKFAKGAITKKALILSEILTIVPLQCFACSKKGPVPNILSRKTKDIEQEHDSETNQG